MKVKVCGLTQLEQVDAFDKIGIQYAGFIFYPHSPRCVLKHLSKNEIKNIKGDIQKVGVFVNEPLSDLLSTIVDAGLDKVQLHGNESIEYVKEVAKTIKVIKAISITSAEELQEKIAMYEPYVEMFLLDTPSKKYGGTGQKFDWNSIALINIDKPFLLSGGITPDDHALLQKFYHFPIAQNLHAIDINSRFEIEPGNKDIELIKGFVNQLNTFNYAK